MPADYDDSKVTTRRFIHAIVFFVFVFLFLYLLFWSKGSYTDMKNTSNETMRQTKDCMGYSFDIRNVYYDDGELSFDVYLLGFSEAPIETVTVIPDVFRETQNKTFVKDFTFKRELKPGDTKPVSVKTRVDSSFEVIVKGCLSFPIEKSIK